MIMINKQANIILISGIALSVLCSIACLFFSVICALICLLSGIFISTLFYCATKNRLKAINKLNNYLSLVCSGNYDMDISENTEGEISILKNNLLKVVVLLKTQNEQLEKDKLYLADSLADITHQLKTPLTSMTVMSDLIKNESDAQKQQEFLCVMDGQLDKMNYLISSLLKISKLDAGTTVMNREAVNVNALFDNALSSFGGVITKRNITVLRDLNDCEIFCDKFWTVEAFQNIIKNAIEHISDSGVLTFSSTSTALFDEVCISDNGCGISKEDLSHIFERFYSCNNSSSESVGIGLALSKTIFEKQRATVEVESTPDVGTTFRIKFYKTVV